MDDRSRRDESSPDGDESGAPRGADDPRDVPPEGRPAAEPDVPAPSADRIPIASSVDLDWTDPDADAEPPSGRSRTASADEPPGRERAGPTDGEPERTSSPSGTRREPDPARVRFWAGLSGALGAVAVSLAAFVQWRRPTDAATTTIPPSAPGESIVALSGVHPGAVGAALLGLVFLAIALLGSRRYPRLLGSLADGWAEHRRYVGVTAGLFAAGIVGGLAMGAAGYDLLEIITELTGQDPFAGIEEADLTASWFVRNNTLPFLIAIGGAVTLGLLTAYILVFNGLLVGNVAWFVGGLVGVDYLLVGLLPHGIFELTALFVAAGVGFRLLHRFGQRLRGTREAFLTRPYLRRTVALVGFAWLVLVLAAFVEVYVTSALLEELFADRLEALETV